jgi:hypothetical protein
MSIYHLLHLSDLLSLLGSRSLLHRIASPLNHNVCSHLDSLLLRAEQRFNVSSLLIEYVHSDLLIDQLLMFQQLLCKESVVPIQFN